jgi:hypothetical protein
MVKNWLRFFRGRIFGNNAAIITTVFAVRDVVFCRDDCIIAFEFTDIVYHVLLIGC